MHKASVNERLQKAKSMAVEAPSYAAIGSRHQHFSAAKHSSGGSGMSTAKKAHGHSAMKHAQSYNHGGGGTARRGTTEAKPSASPEFDVDFFGASDIQIGQQASPMRDSRNPRASNHSNNKR